MAMTDAGDRGEALVEELRWVHGVIRRDLGVIRQLAVLVRDGLSAEEVGAQLRALQSSGPLWQLKVNCLHYCRFVHGHHTNEDVNIFPALRASDPAMNPVVDRLEADHRRVADHLDEVTAASAALGQDDTPAARERVVLALDELAAHLIAHLDFEEEAISPTLRTWDAWPYAR
jgi:hypothetical protein